MRGMNIILKNSILFFLLLGCSQSSANMETALTTVVENGTAVTLEQITDFEWDKVYVIGPYDQFDYSHISHVPAGVRFTNPHTEQSIFLPFVPAKEEDIPSTFGDEDSYGAYLSSSLSNKEHPYFAVISENGWRLADYPFKLYFGFAIRPVFGRR